MGTRVSPWRVAGDRTEDEEGIAGDAKARGEEKEVAEDSGVVESGRQHYLNASVATSVSSSMPLITSQNLVTPKNMYDTLNILSDLQNQIMD